MSLVRVAEVLGHAAEHHDETALQVVVYEQEGRSVGLVVDRVLDIVTGPRLPAIESTAAGTIGGVVLDGAVTDVLDVAAIVGIVVDDALAGVSA